MQALNTEETKTRKTGVTMLMPALALSLSLIVPAEPARAQGAPMDPTTLGPQVGDTVPDFTLTDHRGEVRTLASLYGPRGLMLVFNRSADW